jgi:hypothetical protein
MEKQITAVKFETVNGKKTGKSFSFKADPKKLAVFKTEATLKKKIEEYDHILFLNGSISDSLIHIVSITLL